MELFDLTGPLPLRNAASFVLDRAQPLEALIALAYQDPSGAAWRDYQLGLYKLNRRSELNWTEDWASNGLRRLIYEFEDRYSPREKVPSDARTPQEFTSWCMKLLPSIETINTPLLEFMLTGNPSREQWRTYAASMYGRGVMHHVNLARLALQLDDIRHQCFVYRLLGDEGGQGTSEKAHATLILPFLQHLGGSVDDTGRISDMFESKVLYNWMRRVFTHPNPVWGVASMFYLENQAAAEFTAMLPRLRQLNFPESVLEFFVIHGHDPEKELHNHMCRTMLQEHISSQEDFSIALTAITRAGVLFRDLFAAVGRLMGL